MAASAASTASRSSSRRSRCSAEHARRRVAKSLSEGSRRVGRRPTTVAILLVAVVLALGLALGSMLVPSSVPARHGTPVAASTTASPRSTTPTSTVTTAPTTTTTVDPGTLPQTDQQPLASTPQFATAVTALWQGIMTGSVVPAMPAFFPQSAYAQLKTGVADPAEDWQNRLVADYALDVGAAHDLLGAGAAAATFVSLSVPEQYAHWVPPGVCANGIGYWEVANARLVYSEGGQTSSFGIASLISWRGEWYVVHLGAIVRSGTGGEVDQPASGPGSSAPSSTC